MHETAMDGKNTSSNFDLETDLKQLDVDSFGWTPIHYILVQGKNELCKFNPQDYPDIHSDNGTREIPPDEIFFALAFECNGTLGAASS